MHRIPHKPHQPPSKTEAQAQRANAKQLATVTVVGIRASLQKSLDTKRNADAHRRCDYRYRHRQVPSHQRCRSTGTGAGV